LGKGVMAMEEVSVNSQEKEIDLRVLFDILRKNLILMIVVSIVFGGAFYAYSKFFITKQYEATAMLIVNNFDEKKSTLTNTEITAAQGLADLYSVIIKSDRVMNLVIENLSLSTTPDALKKNITVSTVNSTQVISIAMRHPNTSYAKDVVAEIIKVTPEIIKKTVDAGSVRVLGDEPVISNNGAPVSPNSLRNGIIGALVGFLLVLAIAFIREFTNTTFKTEEDISRLLNIPLLGLIPSVDAKDFNKTV